MSGGHFDYLNDSLCREIFGWTLDCNYGERGFAQSPAAGRINPLEDRVISEIVWDVFCLLHSFDWYKSDDTGEEDYREDVERFKKKWLKTIPKARIKEIVDDEIAKTEGSLYKAFNIQPCKSPWQEGI